MRAVELACVAIHTRCNLHDSTVDALSLVVVVHIVVRNLPLADKRCEELRLNTCGQSLCRCLECQCLSRYGLLLIEYIYNRSVLSLGPEVLELNASTCQCSLGHLLGSKICTTISSDIGIGHALLALDLHISRSVERILGRCTVGLDYKLESLVRIGRSCYELCCELCGCTRSAKRCELLPRECLSTTTIYDKLHKRIVCRGGKAAPSALQSCCRRPCIATLHYGHVSALTIELHVCCKGLGVLDE